MKLSEKLLNLEIDFLEVLDPIILLHLEKGATISEHYDMFVWITGDRFENSQLYIEINKGEKNVLY